MVPYGATQSERTVMARALALLFAAGGALVAVTLLLPAADGVDRVLLAVPPALAFGVAGTLLALGPRASVGALQAFLVGGSVLITGCVLAAGEGAGAYPALYVLVASYAFFFFRLRAALLQIAIAGALYAFALAVGGDDTRVPETTWLMVLGTIVTAGALIGRLVAAIRAQAADLAAVSAMAGDSDVGHALRAVCEGVVTSLGADVAIVLGPAAGGGGLTVEAMAGSAEGGLVFNGEQARLALQRAFVTAGPVAIEADEPRSGAGRLRGTTLGLAQPVVREGAAAAVLAVAWTTPRRGLPARTSSVALLFAAEASLALDRADRVAQDRERQALEINDGIVQGLVVAKYTAQRGDVEAAIGAIDETLVRARELISDQLADVVAGRGIQPGDLARAAPAGVGDEPDVSPAAPAPLPPPASPR